MRHIIPRREVRGESLDYGFPFEFVLTVFLFFPVGVCVFAIFERRSIKFEPGGFGDLIAALFAVLLSIWLANIFATLCNDGVRMAPSETAHH